MPVYFNNVEMTVSGTPGTGDVVLGSAVTAKNRQSFASAGAVNGDVGIPVRFDDGAAWELSICSYLSPAPTLTGRALVQSSTGSLLSLTSSARVTCDVHASFFNEISMGNKGSVRLATKAALPSSSYASPAGTITGSANGVLVVDAFNVALGDLLIVKDETSNKNRNGFYKCTQAGAVGAPFILTRMASANTWLEHVGGFAFVEEGAVNAFSMWLCAVTKTGTLHSTDINFVRYPAIRELLTANRTYFVRTDGNDANSGLANSAALAFLTVQRAIDVAASIDLGSFKVTINVSDATRTATVKPKSYVGAGPIEIIGNTTTPANCIISVTGAGVRAIDATAVVGKYVIKGFKLVSANNIGLLVAAGSRLEIDNIDFGACGFSHTYITAGASLEWTQSGAITFSGGSGAHAYCELSSSYQAFSSTLTLTGTPNFTDAVFVPSRVSTIIFASITIASGTATGKKYSAITNGVFILQATLPGDVAGTTATGGQAA